jgi:hypothetical protein
LGGIAAPYGSEVLDILISEWNTDTALATGHEARIVIGEQRGRKNEQRMIITNLRQRKLPDEEIASIVNLPLEKVREICV